LPRKDLAHSTFYIIAARCALDGVNLLTLHRPAVLSPWLSDASNFQVVHNACRTAVERAMTQLAEDTEAAVRADEPTAANFKSLLELMATDDVSNHAGHQEASRTLSAELKERLNTALEALSRVCKARHSCSNTVA
jgi:hypothetical protein